MAFLQHVSFLNFIQNAVQTVSHFLSPRTEHGAEKTARKIKPEAVSNLTSSRSLHFRQFKELCSSTHMSRVLLWRIPPSQRQSLALNYFSFQCYEDHVSNEEVKNRTIVIRLDYDYDRTEQAGGPHEDPLSTVKRRKLRWFGHITRGKRASCRILERKKKSKTFHSFTCSWDE